MIFGHICRWDQSAVYVLYSEISTDPGLLKIRHSHRFVAVVIQLLIPIFLSLSLSKIDFLRQGFSHGAGTRSTFFFFCFFFVCLFFVLFFFFGDMKKQISPNSSSRI